MSGAESLPANLSLCWAWLGSSLLASQTGRHHPGSWFWLISNAHCAHWFFSKTLLLIEWYQVKILVMMFFPVKILFSRPFSHSQPTGLEYLQLHLLLPLPTHWSLLMTPLFKSRSKWRNPKLEEIGCHQIIHEDLDNCETKFPLKRLIIKPLSPCRVLVSTV